MTDKQALRQAAEKALPAMKRLLMMPNDELFDEALLNVDGDVDAANAFNLLAGPETMLALLDELEHYKSREERVTKLVLDNSASWNELYKKLEAAEKRIAELEGVKPIGYFAYDTDGGFTNHETAERAQEEAQNAIDYFRGDACDGWSEEVNSVCWGAIIQQAEKVDEIPVTSEDKCASHIECYCDYELLPSSNSAAGIGKGE